VLFALDTKKPSCTARRRGCPTHFVSKLTKPVSLAVILDASSVVRDTVFVRSTPALLSSFATALHISAPVAVPT
jgi:hypothetical protein